MSPSTREWPINSINSGLSPRVAKTSPMRSSAGRQARMGSDSGWARKPSIFEPTDVKQPKALQNFQEWSVDAPVRARSPYSIIWMFAAIVLSLLILANFSFGVLSSVRAYVGGESRWSKAQKDAVFHLQKYAITRAPQDLQRFRENISVPLGDHAARLEMNNSRPDFQKGRQGFIQGGNNVDDIDGMFSLYRRFGRVRFMRQAIQAWESADRYIIQLDEAARSLQREIESSSPRPKDIQASLDQASSINEKLTPIDNQFVEALSEASRTAYSLLRAILFAATPLLLFLETSFSLP